MAREMKDYRENLRMIQELYPGRVNVTMKEACKLADVKDPRRLKNDSAFPATKIGGKYAIPIPALARYLSNLNSCLKMFLD